MQYGANAPQALSCAICRTKDTKDSAHTVLFASALPLCVCRCSFRSCHPKTSMLRFGVQLAIEGGLGLRGVAAPLLSLSQHWAGVAVQPVVQLHTSVPALAQTSQGPERQTKQPQAMSDHQKALQADPALRRKALVNSLLYRSRQRGFLEMDLLVGIWAEKQVPNLGEDMLVQFSQVLDQENPDLYKWLTGQEQPPAAMAGNAAYQVCGWLLVCRHTCMTDGIDTF